MTGFPRSKLSSIAAVLLMMGGLALFVALAFSGYRSLQDLDAETALRSRARTSLVHAGAVFSALKDVETGQRGFALTGDENYLEPFRAGSDEVGRAFERLRAESAPLSGLDFQLDALRLLVDGRVALARRNVAARRHGGLDGSVQKAMLDEGRAAMDLIRARFADVEARLRDEIDLRNRRVETLMERALLTSLLLTFTGVVLIAAAYVLLQREQRRRRLAERALRDANALLEDAVARRTAELEAALGQIETFALHLDRTIEAERRRLAREVHDQLGQVFTALSMVVHQALNGVPGRAGELERINTLLGDGIATVRRIASALRPPLLDDLGLGAALTHAARQFGERVGVACEVRVRDSERLNAEQATQLFRIAQEALTNVARHAAASRVWIDGEAVGQHYRLVFEDDGRGMGRDVGPSLGLISMRERASLAGGELALESGRTGGVRVQVSLPLDDSKEPERCES
jgi:protein-histidine pros-kinase